MKKVITREEVKSTFILVVIGLLILLLVTASGCYYDKEEVLYPESACDTAAVTYSKTVVPVLSASCYLCHGGTTPSAGIKLDTYIGVKQQADNGRLLGTINHAPGYAAMPKNGNKLSACNIAKVRKWINAGAPNN